MLPCNFQQCLGPVITLTTERCSETGAFSHSSNYILRSQNLSKLLSYEGDLFFPKCVKFYKDFKNAIEISEIVYSF